MLFHYNFYVKLGDILSLTIFMPALEMSRKPLMDNDIFSINHVERSFLLT